MAAIRFENARYQINSATLVRDLTFQIEDGETLVLLGRSGSGKSTTLKLINALLLPSAGDVLVQEKSTSQWDPISLRRRIGYVIQEIGLFPHFTVARNVGLVPMLEKWNPEKIEARVREVLQLVGLDPDQFLQRYPDELSGGQRQRVGVARGLAADPPVLLLDEPFGALDPITRSEIQKEFLQLQQRLKKTMVFVTHDVAEALLLGSRIGLMKDGTMMALGTPETFQNSTDPGIQAFFNK